MVYYLKSSVIAEPLINNWYASSFLVAPHTYSLILISRIIPALESFLKSPTLHQDAAAQKKLQGGIFVGLSHEDLDQAKKLLCKLKNDLLENHRLAHDIKNLYRQLKYFSLSGEQFSDFYLSVPESIQGFVELTYDTLNQPSVKFYEQLLYRSAYYQEEWQSVLFYEKNPDDRSFVLSTPRLNIDKSCLLSFPFRNKIFDVIFSSREIGISNLELSEISKKFEPEISRKIFLSFFEKFSPKRDSGDFKIKYFGHACVLVQLMKTNILIDPYIAYENRLSKISRYSYADLPDVIDYVLLTHSHLDHASLETLLQIRYKIKNIVIPHNNAGSILDPSLKLFLYACGFENIIQLDEFEKINFFGGNILAIPFMGEHGDLAIQSKISYVITIADQSIAFMADSNNLCAKLYDHIQKILSKNIDIVFIGMECEGAPVNWLYGPLLMQPLTKAQNQSRRLNGSDSQGTLSLLKALGCKRAYIYAMGDEPWLKFISSISESKNSIQSLEANKLIELAKTEKIIVKRLFGSQEIAL